KSFTMSARMSLSENTAAKRSLGLSCAHAGTMPEAASAAPAFSAERRSILKSMTSSCFKYSTAGLENGLGHQPTEDDVGHLPASAGHISLGAHRPLENGAEGELVRDVEHPQRG